MSQNFQQLYQVMAEQKLDLMLVTDKINRRYLCGFTGSSGLLIASPRENILIIDGRYTEQAAQQTMEVTIHTFKAGETHWQAAASYLPKNSRVGIEQDALNYGDYLALAEISDPTCQLVPTQNLVEQLRMIKTSAELKKIQAAAELADRTFAYALTIIKPGMTELELANEIDYYSKKIGSDGPAFETIVASGERTALPHAHASHKVISADELIMIDFGCIVEGYYSDMTRTFALGSVASEIKASYQLLADAQQAALDAIAVGKKLAAIDGAAREHLASAGQADYFAHGLGHGIGLSCHEYPYLNQTSQAILQPQMVFTVEPGIYYEGRYGIRIEDDVYVNQQGEKIILTKSNKEWMSI